MAKRKTQKKSFGQKWRAYPLWQRALAVGVIFGGGSYALSQLNKQPKEPEFLPGSADQNYSPVITAPVVTAPVVVPPSAVEPTALEKSYKSVNDYFAGLGLPITKYGDRIEMSLTYNGVPRKVQFWNNGRFMFYNKPIPLSQTWVVTTKGNYTAGGKVLTITDGAKKGQIKNGSDVLMNIKNAM